MPDLRPYTNPLRALLEQGARLAAELDAETFVRAPVLSPDGSVGAHLRHVADSVRLFLRGAETGHVDYDRRERDERLERDPARARAHLVRLADELRRLESRDPSQAIEVRAEACVLGEGWLRSTLARELAALLSHAVHHYALIAVLLRAEGLEPPADLGVAPSTLEHWNEERTACAPPPG